MQDCQSVNPILAQALPPFAARTESAASADTAIDQSQKVVQLEQLQQVRMAPSC